MVLDCTIEQPFNYKYNAAACFGQVDMRGDPSNTPGIAGRATRWRPSQPPRSVLSCH